MVVHRPHPPTPFPTRRGSRWLLGVVSNHLAAVEYVGRGMHVFPLTPQSKIPATPNGVHGATLDVPTVDGWWSFNPRYGIGLACGPSGLLVVDVDRRAGFSSADEALGHLHLPHTYTVSTPSGGWHFYYWQSDALGNSVDRLCQGVDTRGVGGYVVAPPTAGYEILSSDYVAELPRHIVERLSYRPAVSEKAPIDPVEVLRGVPEGRRNDVLFRYACRLRNQGLTAEEALVLVASAGENCDPPVEASLTASMVSRVWDSYDGPETPETPNKGPLRPLKDFTSSPVEWLWYLRVPLGKLTVIAGVQGKGKSYLAAALAADVTRGRPLPGGVGSNGKGAPLPPSDVVIGAYEDGLGDTLRPRLEALGADLDRIHCLGFWRDGSDTPRPFRSADVPLLAAALDDMPSCRLLIIDPITAFLGGKVDGNSNEQVRDQLEPLVALAETYQVAVIAIAHLNKTELSSALYRISGANAFTALPRSVLMVGQTEAGRRGIAHVKSNLSALSDVVEFHIDTDGYRWGYRVTDLPVKDLLKN